jgi:hypothetical protein
VSDDGGETWTERLTGFNPYSSIAYSVIFGANGIWYIVGGSGGVATSYDADTWTKRPSGATVHLYAVCYGLSTVVMAGQSGTVLTAAGPNVYADEAELLDDALAPAAGTVKVYLAGGYVRLGSPPAGLITADLTEGAAAADRTAGRVFARVLTDPLGGSLVPFADDDIAALDTAIDAEVGFWTDEEMSVAEVADLVARSVGAWWGARKDGTIRIVQFTAPSGSPVVSLTANQLLPLERLPPTDTGRGLPSWRTIVRYARNHVTQDTDLAGGVTDERRAALTKEWREAKAEDTTVRDAHPLAPEMIEDSLLADAAEAAAEATRRQTLRGADRDVLETSVALDDETAVIDLGDVIEITHPRFGLAFGELCRVIGLAPDPENAKTKLSLWR